MHGRFGRGFGQASTPLAPDVGLNSPEGRTLAAACEVALGLTTGPQCVVSVVTPQNVAEFRFLYPRARLGSVQKRKRIVRLRR